LSGTSKLGVDYQEVVIFTVLSSILNLGSQKVKKNNKFLLICCAIAFSTPVLAQQSNSALKTCSQAYNQCFDTCTKRDSKGDLASAKCIDKCSMARAKCDKAGCFNDEGIEACGLVKE
jgi:hypothetical protein